jgi:hypothetical protein
MVLLLAGMARQGITVETAPPPKTVGFAPDAEDLRLINALKARIPLYKTKDVLRQALRDAATIRGIK